MNLALVQNLIRMLPQPQFFSELHTGWKGETYLKGELNLENRLEMFVCVVSSVSFSLWMERGFVFHQSIHKT